MFSCDWQHNLPITLLICISRSSSGIHEVALGLVAGQRYHLLRNQIHFDLILAVIKTDDQSMTVYENQVLLSRDLK